MWNKMRSFNKATPAVPQPQHAPVATKKVQPVEPQQPPLNADTVKQLEHFKSLGYDREDLIVTENGTVMVDEEAFEEEYLTALQSPPKQPENES